MIEILLQNLPYETEKDHENLQSSYPMTAPNFEPAVSVIQV